MSRVLPPPASFDAEVPLVIIGAGAAGLCAALAAKEAGVEPIVIERDAVLAGSTALSAGLIPAAGTRFQRAKGIEDSPVLFAQDIQRKAQSENDAALVDVVTRESGPTVEWLAEMYGLPFDVIDNFNYPGHSAMRMHGLPTRSGVELIDRLRSAAEASDIPILAESRVEQLFADEGGRIRGVELARNDGTHERIGCNALILACNGYGGNKDLVRELIPDMADALYFGHAGNQGEAILWGRALGVKLDHLGAYQGHGSVTTPYNILVTWAVIMEGGFQVNAEGRRFCDESRGYSEQAVEVLRQPGHIAWNVFDERIANIARQFEDFRAAEKSNALVTANSVEALATRMHVPLQPFQSEWAEIERLKAANGQDRYGRRFKAREALVAPFYAVKVTGALFHTQGGLAINAAGQVKRQDGTLFPNLFAAGGAASGLSGETAAGYLSGNGLLTACVLGRLSARAAAALVTGDDRSNGEE